MGTFKDGLPHGFGKEQYPAKDKNFLGGWAIGTFVCRFLVSSIQVFDCV